jgi:ATP-dependent Zn protease
MNFVSVRSTDLLSKYFGDTENIIRGLFKKARSVAPCVLFFDDFDAIAHKRYKLGLFDYSFLCHYFVVSLFFEQHCCVTFLC